MWCVCVCVCITGLIGNITSSSLGIIFCQCLSAEILVAHYIVHSLLWISCWDGVGTVHLHTHTHTHARTHAHTHTHIHLKPMHTHTHCCKEVSGIIAKWCIMHVCVCFSDYNIKCMCNSVIIRVCTDILCIWSLDGNLTFVAPGCTKEANFILHQPILHQSILHCTILLSVSLLCVYMYWCIVCTL